MSQTIGQIIKRLRKERNLTQEELAELINVTPQAVSKWENGTGLPDISQIVPLASVFGVSSDTLFGLDGTSTDAEILEIVKRSEDLQEYGKTDTYLRAYDELANGLKKYPNNMMLLNNCVRLGLALSLPENGYLYDSDRAAEIASETIRRANLIISYSQNISDVLSARQVLLVLYSHNKDFHKATQEAMSFPVRTDFTLYSNLARVNEYMGNHVSETTFLCSDIDYSLQALEDNIARLGKSYYNIGKYQEAIETYETFFAVMKAVFGNCPPPYHDFDSGDCYILLARAYAFSVCTINESASTTSPFNIISSLTRLDFS